MPPTMPRPSNLRERHMAGKLDALRWLGATMLLAASAFASAQSPQVTADDYARAEKMLAHNTAPLVDGLVSNVTWLDGSVGSGRTPGEFPCADTTADMSTMLIRITAGRIFKITKSPTHKTTRSARDGGPPRRTILRHHVARVDAIRPRRKAALQHHFHRAIDRNARDAAVLVDPPVAGDPGTTPVPSKVILNDTVSSPIRLNLGNTPFAPCPAVSLY